MWFKRLFGRKLSKREKEIDATVYRKLGVKPNDLNLYILAFRHKSAARNIYNLPDSSNERLEFLGDTILDAIIAGYLYNKYPKAEEGELTRMKSRLVSRYNLNKLALGIELHLLIETDLQADGSRESLGGNALEAFIGAIYLDHGYERTRRFVIGMLEKYSDIDQVEYQEADFKSRLFEQAHRMRQELRFETRQVREEGSKKIFLSKAFLGAKLLGTGEGLSKKKAEQAASKEGLQKLNKA